MMFASGAGNKVLASRYWHGITLVELLIVMAIIGILAVLVGPGMSSFIASNRMAMQSNRVAGMFQFARSEAARLGRPVRVKPTPASPSNSNEWGEGWDVEALLDGTNWRSLKSFPALASGTTLDSASDVTLFTFLPNGRFKMDDGSGGGLYPDRTGARMPSLDMCDSRSNQVGRVISLSFSGQATVRRVAVDSNGVPVPATDPC